MPNGDGKRERQKKSVSLISKKTTTTLYLQHTFLVNFFDVVLHDYIVELASYTYYVGNVVCAHQKLCSLCSCSLFYSLPLIFTLVAASISHFYNGNFHGFLPTTLVFFVFYLTL